MEITMLALLDRIKSPKLAKALEYLLEGLIAFMVASAFIIWIVTLHWLSAPV
jgi:hypothetical protein